MNNLLSSLSRLPLRHALVIQQSQSKVQTIRQSSPIRSKSPLNILLAACQRVKNKAEAEREDNTLSQESSDIEDNYTLLPHTIFADENLLEINNSLSKEENDWEDDNEGKKESRLFA